jgi:hypothetical protein
VRGHSLAEACYGAAEPETKSAVTARHPKREGSPIGVNVELGSQHSACQSLEKSSG